ncbi:hypothetical protein QZN11_36250, partial [Streptomyces gramineus]|uniref:hypothetical protein n=1 Tax=Streptomyces gramineus TaxID=910542 RepID=UPI00398A615A
PPRPRLRGAPRPARVHGPVGLGEGPGTGLGGCPAGIRTIRLRTHRAHIATVPGRDTVPSRDRHTARIRHGSRSGDGHATLTCGRHATQVPGTGLRDVRDASRPLGRDRRARGRGRPVPRTGNRCRRARMDVPRSG